MRPARARAAAETPASAAPLRRARGWGWPGRRPSPQLGDLPPDHPIARIVLSRLPVLAERRLELVHSLVLAGAIEMGARRGEHRPLERNLVGGILGRRLNSLAIRRHGHV